MTAKRPRPAFWALAIACAFAMWRVFGGDAATDALELRLLDLRFEIRGPWSAAEIEDAGVLIVAIDEASAAAYPGAASRRAALAAALPAILSGEPLVVAIDLVFGAATPADTALAEAVAADDRVLLAASALNEAIAAPSSAPELRAMLDRSAIPVVVGRSLARRPASMLLPTTRIASAARIGHVNLIRSRDGFVRAAPLALPTRGGVAIPALPLAAAARALEAEILLICGERTSFGNVSAPVDERDALVIDHVGGRGSIPSVSLLDISQGRVRKEVFHDRIVFVGATAESFGDVVATSLAPSISGVETLAAVAAGLLNGRWIIRDERTGAISVFLAIAACLGCLVAARVRSGAGAFAAGGAVFACVFGALIWSFSAAGLWLDGSAALLGLVAGAAAGGRRRYAAAIRRGDRATRERANLAKYVAPDLADLLAHDGSPGFSRRPQFAAVLFVDVEGFTSYAETASPAEIPEYLAALHARFADVSARHHGVIIDFQGDGAMIVFGLPDARPDDAARALACGQEFIECADEGLRLRVSANYGPVIAAVLGGERQAVVTVTGDTVNLASRLQETAKQMDRRFVCTRESLKAAGADLSEKGSFAFLTRTVVRGRKGVSEIWSLKERETGRTSL